MILQADRKLISFGVLLMFVSYCTPQQEEFYLDCYWDQGLYYAGTANHTIGGKTCQKWNAQSPHAVGELDPGLFPSGEIDHNYCRNPDGKGAPWCYTTDEQTPFEMCDIPACSASLCKRTRAGLGYAGKVNVTIDNIPCQAWRDGYPHNHSKKAAKFPEDSLDAAENYCRNPDGSPNGPWCYTSDPYVRWEYCEVPKCTPKPKPPITTSVQTSNHTRSTHVASGTQGPLYLTSDAKGANHHLIVRILIFLNLQVLFVIEW